MAELTQIMVANNLIKLAQGANEGSFEVSSAICEDLSRGCRKERRVKLNIETESQSDSKFVVSGKRRVSPSRTHFGKVACQGSNPRKKCNPRKINNLDCQVHAKRANLEVPNPIHVEDRGNGSFEEVHSPKVYYV